MIALLIFQLRDPSTDILLIEVLKLTNQNLFSEREVIHHSMVSDQFLFFKFATEGNQKVHWRSTSGVFQTQYSTTFSQGFLVSTLLTHVLHTHMIRYCQDLIKDLWLHWHELSFKWFLILYIMKFYCPNRLFNYVVCRFRSYLFSKQFFLRYF